MQDAQKRLQNFDVEISGKRNLIATASNADGGKKSHLTSTLSQYPRYTTFNTPDRPGWPLNYRGSTTAISQNIPLSVRRAPSVKENNLNSIRGQFITKNGGSTLEHLPGASDNMESLVAANSHNLNATIHDATISGIYNSQITGRSKTALKNHYMGGGKEKVYEAHWQGNTVAGSSGTDMISVNPSHNKDRDRFPLQKGTQDSLKEAQKAGFKAVNSGMIRKGEKYTMGTHFDNAGLDTNVQDKKAAVDPFQQLRNMLRGGGRPGGGMQRALMPGAQLATAHGQGAKDIYGDNIYRGYRKAGRLYHKRKHPYARG